MTDDSGHPIQPRPTHRLVWDLPRVLEARLRITKLPHDIHMPHFGRLPAGEEVQEVVAKLDGEVPVRALSPELVVGDVRLTEGRAENAKTLVFYAQRDTKLGHDAPVRLGWTRLPPDENVAAATLRAAGDLDENEDRDDDP